MTVRGTIIAVTFVIISAMGAADGRKLGMLESPVHSADYDSRDDEDALVLNTDNFEEWKVNISKFERIFWDPEAKEYRDSDSFGAETWTDAYKDLLEKFDNQTKLKVIEKKSIFRRLVALHYLHEGFDNKDMKTDASFLAEFRANFANNLILTMNELPTIENIRSFAAVRLYTNHIEKNSHVVTEPEFQNLKRRCAPEMKQQLSSLHKELKQQALKELKKQQKKLEIEQQRQQELEKKQQRQQELKLKTQQELEAQQKKLKMQRRRRSRHVDSQNSLWNWIKKKICLCC